MPEERVDSDYPEVLEKRNDAGALGWKGLLLLGASVLGLWALAWLLIS